MPGGAPAELAAHRPPMMRAASGTCRSPATVVGFFRLPHGHCRAGTAPYRTGPPPAWRRHRGCGAGAARDSKWITDRPCRQRRPSIAMSTSRPAGRNDARAARHDPSISKAGYRNRRAVVAGSRRRRACMRPGRSMAGQNGPHSPDSCAAVAPAGPPPTMITSCCCAFHAVVTPYSAGVA